LFYYAEDQAPPEAVKGWIEDMTVTTENLKKLYKVSEQSPESFAKSPIKPYIVKIMERGELPFEELIPNIAVFLFAALDTTANSLSWLIYNLARTPKAQEKLYEEIHRVTQGGPLLKSHINNIPYLKACVKENFRLNQISSGNTRILPVDINIRGYHIPAGTSFHMQTISSYSYDPKIYENPYDFVPERWLKDS